MQMIRNLQQSFTMFLLSLLVFSFSSSCGELISFRGLSGSKPAVSNATSLTSIFTSRHQGWEEPLHFRCELRKDDYAANSMAKHRFSKDCLSESPLGVVPQMMGKLASCYCSFNLTVCDKQIEVKSCVLAGPARRSTHGVESTYFYHVGFRATFDHQLLDGRIDIMTDSSDLPRNLSLADEPAAIMASEFSGWAYRVELECFAIRSSNFCKKLTGNITKPAEGRPEVEYLAVIFGMAASIVLACLIMFLNWVFKERSKGKKNKQYQQLILDANQANVRERGPIFEYRQCARIFDHGENRNNASSAPDMRHSHQPRATYL